MKVLIVGGGSGGHIAPALAVADELKRQHPDYEIDYLIGRRDRLTDIVRGHASIANIYEVYSGKFRRYHGAGILQIFDLPTTFKNLRDVIYIIIGFFQSLLLLRRIRPDILFVKGGFVGVPVGLAAALLKIPYITHDSDAIPGLANRIISRWATAHAVAMPKEAYKYPANKTFQVGTPIAMVFSLVTAEVQKACKQSFGIPDTSQVILVTGGGLGAQRLSMAVTKIAYKLMGRYPELVILHIAGRGKDDEIGQAYKRVLLNEADLDRVEVEPFVTDMERYSGAADVIITRAGANSLAEFAAQAKACIVVPNHQLTGGHQTKNADILAGKQAIISLTDESVQKNPELLLQQIELLLSDPARRLTLARNLHGFSDTEASNKLAKLVVDSIPQKVTQT